MKLVYIESTACRIPISASSCLHQIFSLSTRSWYRLLSRSLTLLSSSPLYLCVDPVMTDLGDGILGLFSLCAGLGLVGRPGDPSEGTLRALRCDSGENCLRMLGS